MYPTLSDYILVAATDGEMCARRSEWLYDNVRAFVEDPHAAIASNLKVRPLNLTSKNSFGNRLVSTSLAAEKPEKTLKQFTKVLELKMPNREIIGKSDIKPENLQKVLLSTYERQPADFEQLLSIKGVGPKTIRALALISELIYKAPASREDPVKYSFAHGGKDGTPYSVDRKTYDKSIEILRTAIKKATIGDHDKIKAF